MRFLAVFLFAAVPIMAQIFLPHRGFTAAPASSADSTNPPFFANLVMWLDAASLQGTVADGGNVDYWTDSTAYTHDWIYDSGLGHPTLSSNLVNSRPGVYFNTTNSTFLTMTNGGTNAILFTSTCKSNLTAFYVLKVVKSTFTGTHAAGVAVNNWGFYNGITDVPPSLYPTMNANYGPSSNHIYSSFASTITSPSQGDFGEPFVDLEQWSRFVQVTDTTNMTVYVDNYAMAARTNNGIGVPSSYSLTWLGKAAYDAGAAHHSLYYNGWMAEILVYRTNLTASEVGVVDAWLTNRYNLATTAPPTSPVTSSLYMWWDASQLSYANNDPVSQWDDESGNGVNGTQATAINQPVFKTNMVNGLPAVQFDGTNDFLDHATFPSLAAGEAFIVVKVDADPPGVASKSGLWTYGNSGASPTHFPFTDGVIYDRFLSTARKNTGNPSLSLASWRVYNAVSSTNWYSYIDQTLHYSNSVNTVAMSGTPSIGKSDNTYFLQGYVAEVLLYTNVLTTAQRWTNNTYLRLKYDFLW